MKKTSRGTTLADAVFAAFDELAKAINRPEGISIEEVQAGVEFLLDVIKDAGLGSASVIVRPKSSSTD